MVLTISRQRQVVILIIVCFAVLGLLVYKTGYMSLEYKAENREAKDPKTIAKLIAESQRSIQSQEAVEKKCPMYHEFRHLDFLHPALRLKLCRNAEAYKMYKDGFPMCQLSNPFNEDMLNVVRQGSDVTKLDCMNNTSVQMRVYKGNDLISNTIRRYRSWEPELVHRTLRFALKVPRVTFLDVGSNIGVYSIQAAKLGLPVVSLDANIRNLLRLRLSLNAASLNADLVWNFIAPDEQLKYLSFLADCNVGGAGRDKSDLPDTVPVMPLRSEKITSLIKTKNVVMKMDIQGGETDFLKMSGRLFTDFTVAAVQVEWYTPMIRGDDGLVMIKFFVDRGYKVWQIPSFKPLDTNNSKSWGTFADIVWIHKNFVGLM